MKNCLAFLAAAIALGLCGCWPEMQMSAAPDGTIYFTSDGKLYRVEKELSKATEIGKGFYLVEVSPDGKRLLCMKGDAGDTDIVHSAGYATPPKSKAERAEAAKKIHFEMVICDLVGKVLKEIDAIKGKSMNAEPVAPRWSPDGKYVSYLWKWAEESKVKEGKKDDEPLLRPGLRVAQADGTKKLVIPSTAAEHAWSSDSKRVYVFGDRNAELGNENAVLSGYDVGSVVAVSDLRKKASWDSLYNWEGPTEGETAEKVRDLAIALRSMNHDYAWVGCSVTTDSILFSSRRSVLPVAAGAGDAAQAGRGPDTRIRSGIYAVDAMGEKIGQIVDNGPGYGFFEISPDGKKMLYSVWSRDPSDNTASLYVAGIDGSEPERVGQWATQDVFPIWVGNDKIVYGKDMNNTTRIIVKTIGGREVDITGVLNAAGCKVKIVQLTPEIPGITTYRRPRSTAGGEEEGK